jgi:hypothetical protein
MPTVYVMTYSNLGRTAALAVAAFFASAMPATATAATSDHDVHVTAVGDTCINIRTVYEFKLENRGDRDRAVHGVIRWRGQDYSESFNRRVRVGDSTKQRVALFEGQEAVLTFRSQGDVVFRAHMYAHCRKLVR